MLKNSSDFSEGCHCLGRVGGDVGLLNWQGHFQEGYTLVYSGGCPLSKRSAYEAAIWRVTRQGSVILKTQSRTHWDRTSFWVFQGSQLLPDLASVLQLPPNSCSTNLLVVNMRACSVASVVSDSLLPWGLEPIRLLCPWDSPGKNTGVGCCALP